MQEFKLWQGFGLWTEEQFVYKVYLVYKEITI